MTARAFFLVLALVLSSCATLKQSQHPVVVASSLSGEKYLRIDQQDSDDPLLCPTDPSLYKSLKNGLSEVIAARGEDVHAQYCFLDSQGRLVGASPEFDFKADTPIVWTTVLWRDPAGIAVHRRVVGTASFRDEKNLFQRVSYRASLRPIQNRSVLEVNFQEDPEEAAGGRYLGSRPAVDGPVILLGMLHLEDGRKWMAIGSRNPNQGPCPEPGCEPVPGDPNSCVRTRRVCSLPTHFDGARVSFQFPQAIPSGHHRLTMKTLYGVMPEESLKVAVGVKE